MTKELEALDWLKTKCYVESPQDEMFDECLEVIEKALLELKAIKEAKPSEALECLGKLKGMEISSMPFSDEYGTQEVDLNDIRKVGSQLNTDFRECTDTIKQALLKQLSGNQYNNIFIDEAVKPNKELEALKIMKKYAKNDGWSNGWTIELWKASEKEIKLINEVLE